MQRRTWNKDLPSLLIIGPHAGLKICPFDTPVIKRAIVLAEGWGFGSITMCNLYAWKVGKPEYLSDVRDPIGVDNDDIIIKYAKKADTILIAWGNGGRFDNRDRNMLRLLKDFDLYTIGLTVQSRHPKLIHSRTVYTTKLAPYNHKGTKQGTEVNTASTDERILTALKVRGDASSADLAAMLTDINITSIRSGVARLKSAGHIAISNTTNSVNTYKYVTHVRVVKGPNTVHMRPLDKRDTTPKKVNYKRNVKRKLVVLNNLLDRVSGEAEDILIGIIEDYKNG